jgi:hypothetical protein
MRKGNLGTVSFLLGDHLGSTAITANSSGNKVAELRYKPWGSTRYNDGTTPTSYRYTLRLRSGRARSVGTTRRGIDNPRGLRYDRGIHEERKCSTFKIWWRLVSMPARKP